MTKAHASPHTKDLLDSQKAIPNDNLLQIKKRRNRQKSSSSAVSSHPAEAKSQEPFYNKAMLSVLQTNTHPQKELNEAAVESPSNLAPPSSVKAGSGKRLVLPKRKE